MAASAALVLDDLSRCGRRRCARGHDHRRLPGTDAFLDQRVHAARARTGKPRWRSGCDS